MVKLLQAKEQFAAYCKGYDTQDERVALKIVHSQKVAEISKQLATVMENMMPVVVTKLCASSTSEKLVQSRTIVSSTR